MTTLHALIVEDSPDDAELLRRALTRGGYDLVSEQVQTAPAMDHALQTNQWDVVFSDWAMPQFSAPEAFDVLRKNELDLPFIIVSGTVGEEVAVEALRSGAHDFFAKDRLVRLVPAVERELREANTRREQTLLREQLLISDRMASVGILAAGVGHEINNPLAAVLGNIELALHELDMLRDSTGGGDPRLVTIHEELAEAHASALQIRYVANDLKLFARADNDNRSAVDVEKVIESSLRMAHTEIRHRSRVITSYGKVPAVDANESRLAQVFLNLIVNAAQSIPEGRADENEINVSTSVEPSGEVVVTVRDTGSGMSADVKNRLFTPFFTTKPIGVGTGLGLSICHRIITSFGGTITVASELGKGTTFRVQLLPASRQVAVAPAAPTGPEQQHQRRRGRVLVIDDEPSMCMLARRVLEPMHDVTTTTNAREALEWIQAGQRFDAIVSDVMMPVMTGIDFYEALRDSVPDQAALMIFTSGGAFTDRAREFVLNSSNTHVDKPFNIATLRAAVDEKINNPS
ncbi:MAG TPA: response regulator [Ilumatobacteraceae bacterium]